MVLRTAKAEDFETIYHLLELSFPVDEYRDREGQKALFSDPRYKAFLFENGVGETQGMITLWDLGEITFIEHFAVHPKYRNKGVGSEILQQIMGIHRGMLCLEVEPPETEIGTRRIGFYQRNGFCFNDYPYVQPAFSSVQKPVPLKIMTSTMPVDEERFIQIRKILYREVYHVDA